MEKPVGRDFEDPAAVAGHPRRMLNDAAVVIVDRRRVCYGEGAKRVFSQQAPGFPM